MSDSQEKQIQKIIDKLVDKESEITELAVFYWTDGGHVKPLHTSLFSDDWCEIIDWIENAHE